MSNLSTIIFTKNAKFPWQTIDRETIIIDPQGQDSFELCEMGSFIWNLIDGKSNQDQILTEICNEFDVDPLVAANDLADWLAELKRQKLICELS